MPHLSLRFLGTFQARLAGKQVSRFESNKVRALLAYLAVEGERPHSRDKLAGLLWPDIPNRAALSRLRYALSNLRTAIGDRHAVPPFLLITRDSIQFNPASKFDLDVSSFLDQTSDVNPSPVAARSLESAMRLYRGPFLEGFPSDSASFEEWVMLKREQIEQRVLRTLRHLAEWHADWGDYEKAAGHARLQIELEPWDESGHQLLMRALAMSGQRSAALAQYETCRRVLQEGLGVEPSRETTALCESIRSEALTRSNAQPLRTNLPILLTSFVGRQHEREELTDLLKSTRLLTLIGAGGCGKTRLAVQTARELESRFRDGVWWVNLANLGEPGLVPHAVAAVFGLRDMAGAPTNLVLVQFLRTRELLLILDNCEPLTGACAKLARELLENCPELRIMATTREAFGVAGEVAWRVPGLAFPDANTAQRGSPEELMQYDAIRLFVERAAAVSSRWELAWNAGAVASICSRLDGMPLAIELAAARLKMLTAAQIAERLDDRFRLLTDGSRVGLPRHRTLRAAIDWSYDLLPEEEQVLFRRLSAFAGGWTLKAAERVVCDDAASLLDLLTHLVDKSLVAVEEQNGAMRYRLLETIRLYALEGLIASDEDNSIRARHVKFFLEFAEHAEQELKGSNQDLWLARLEAEHDNLRAALAWALESKTSLLGLDLAAALGAFWWRRGYLTEGDGWLRKMLAASFDAPASARAKALLSLAGISWNLGDYGAASAQAEESLALYRELENTPQIAYGLQALGGIKHFEGDNDQAIQWLVASLVLFRQLGDKWGTAATLLWLADSRMRQRNYDQAASLWGESLALFRDLGDKWGIGFALGGLGDVARLQCDVSRAKPLLQEALISQWDQKNLCDIPFVLEALGATSVAQGQPDRAVRMWGAAECIRESIRSPIPLSYRPDYILLFEQAKAQLGDALYATASSEGRAMTMEQAIEYALEKKRAPRGAPEHQ